MPFEFHAMLRSFIITPAENKASMEQKNEREQRCLLRP